MKKEIKPFEYSSTIFNALSRGILLTTKGRTKINTMVIAWGTLGIEWRIPVFIAYVRTSRFTRACLDENPEFTVNIPIGPYDKRIMAIAGSKSGRDMDKIADLGLTLVEPEIISVPGIKELPLTLECKVIYKHAQDPRRIDPLVREPFAYSMAEEAGGTPVDCHIAYYGQIVASYIIE